MPRKSDREIEPIGHVSTPTRLMRSNSISSRKPRMPRIMKPRTLAQMNACMQAPEQLERALQSAFAGGEFEMFYQPVVSLSAHELLYHPVVRYGDHNTSGFEAVLRWNHPERGTISPAEFFEVAEEAGLIVPLGEWVLREVCRQAAMWPDNINVAVNVSPAQVNNKKLINVVVGAIASAGLPANSLILEVTELVFLQCESSNIATLKQLNELGVRFAMDDFGKGYSSLAHLMSFPFSKIKIDRSIIAGLPEKHESCAFVGAVAELGRSLKMQVAAEGVETADQLEQVRILGCTEAQGYLFSPARPASEIHQLFVPQAQVTVRAGRQVA